jgi:hypothetical protein
MFRYVLSEIVHISKFAECAVRWHRCAKCGLSIYGNRLNHDIRVVQVDNVTAANVQLVISERNHAQGKADFH